jgi:hypothetical protein
MQYHPKLKTAAKEIEDILKKYDIAGVVILHSVYGQSENKDGTFYTNGFSEYIQRYNPSYSCAFIERDMLRIRSKLKDYGGDMKAQQKQLSATYNMITHLSKKTSDIALTLIDMENMLKKHVEVSDDEDAGETSHTQQNN